jgi:hypothetical protein
VDERDLQLRNLTYARFVAEGRAPTAEEVARAAGLRTGELRAAWRRLHDAHALVLDPAGAELRMANPFSAVATPYRVHCDGRDWYANCAWDAFGICAALGRDGRIDSECPDCGEAITVRVSDAAPSDDTLLFHCLVPAAHWWDDIVFT